MHLPKRMKTTANGNGICKYKRLYSLLAKYFHKMIDCIRPGSLIICSTILVYIPCQSKN